jgi:hypothetical protein
MRCWYRERADEKPWVKGDLVSSGSFVSIMPEAGEAKDGIEISRHTIEFHSSSVIIWGMVHLREYRRVPDEMIYRSVSYEVRFTKPKDKR